MRRAEEYGEERRTRRRR